MAANSSAVSSASAFAVRSLAEAAARAGAVFVHYGTDFVFDGRTDRPYRETDPAEPRSVYAASKLLGEWLAREAPRHYVLRVESLFGGAHEGPTVKPSSVDRIIDAVLDGRRWPVFVDRVVSPSFTVDVARATRALVEAEAESGLYHCVNSGQCTWHELGLEVVRLTGRPDCLDPVPVDSVEMLADRPKYAALDNSKLAAALGRPMPTWQDALARYLSSRIPSGRDAADRPIAV
jgi:dTDP-4-dehydrorhamnose reductase